MDTSTLSPRAPGGALPGDRLTRVLGTPIAYLLTTLLLLGLFGWTFVVNPDRVAPTRDPAYYTWRTEALLTESPQTVLEIEGALGMYEGGYRVAAPVLGGFLRQVAGVSTLRMTIVLMAVLPVLIALLLAGFAYRQRRDPLLWHATALGSASLLLTPPFVGYLDNVLCLVFLAASLYFIPGTRDSWPARAAFFLMLLGAGFTHPTTLAIFCLVLGAMAAVKLLNRRFDLRSVIADDGPLLATAFVAGVVMVAVWSIGIWGKSASLGESALSPPYGSDFFVDRLVQWVETMRPVFNAPLLLIGIVGLLATSGRRPAEDELTRVSIVWLAPLVGIFGFLAGAAYPYYRFFNTTLSWVLLVGVGMFFAVRVFIEVAGRGGTGRLALLGIVAIVAIIATNFTTGFDVSGWNKATGGWLPASQKVQLDNLRSVLEDFKGRPVVFVIDDEPARDFQIWGFTKLSGNTSRYGMPEGEVEKAYMYLGDLDNLLAGEPTLRGEDTYDLLSPALLEDLEAGVGEIGEVPIVVVAEAFNPAGANVDLVAGESPGSVGDAEVWVVDREGRVSQYEPGPAATVLEMTDGAPGASPMTSITSLLGMLVLLAAGALGLRFFVGDAELPDALGMVPALSMAILSLLGMVVLAVIRSPFSPGVAWACVVIAIAATAYLRVRSGRTDPALPGRH